MITRTLVGVLAAAAAGATVLAPTPTATADSGWHAVHESWQPYVESNLHLPAARYCGTFDMTLHAISQDIKVKALTRWDDGTPRTEVYTGPLLTRATNETSGSHVDLDLSGRAEVLYRADGSMATYGTEGPVGIGWGAGSGPDLPQGYYRFTGHHVIEFQPDGSKSLVVREGTETEVCALVD
ncbi:hypothetical protein [Luteipulveratus halotolerans]|uniref:hypothetical protein n=1 Tax=Luteipulveratus halotolerans TaxID=1631356 RepID=UPI0006817AA8|nr:hypothetical protein [Luteipulveratus halotolerans]